MKFLKLKELCTIKHGYAFNGKYITQQENNNILVTPGNFKVGGGFKEDKCKYYNSKNIPKEYILNENDLIVTMTDLSKEADTLGYSALIPQKDKIYLHNQRIGLIKNINETIINKDYLYWYLRTRMYHNEIVATSTGTTVHHTSPERILNVKIPIYSLSIQNKISKVLNIIDNRIKINVQTNDNLYELSSSLYKKWYDSLSRDNITTLSKFDEMGKIVMGQSPKGESYNYYNEGLPLINGAADYENGFLKAQKYTTMPTKTCNKNDLIFCIRATIGLLTICDKEYCLGRGVAGIVNINELYREYVFHLINNSIEPFKNLATGSVIVGISKNDIQNIKVKIPSKEQIKNFHNIQKNLFDKMENIRQENIVLTQLRDTLLPKLMNGEIDLEKIEI